jgi:hypothetical protein
MKQIALFMVILALILTGCGFFSQMGRYEGSDPGVALYVTREGIKGGNISFDGKFQNTSYICYIMFGQGQEPAVPISLMGSFSYTQERNDDASNFLSGKLNGDTVSGEYSFEACMMTKANGNVRFNPPLTGKWSARFIKP